MIPYLFFSTFMGSFVLLIGAGVDLCFKWIQLLLMLPDKSVMWWAIFVKLFLFWAYIRQTQMIYVKFFRHYEISHSTPPLFEKILLNASLLGLLTFHYHFTILMIDYLQLTWGLLIFFILSTSLLLGVTIQKWNQSIYQVNVIFMKLPKNK